MYPSIVTSNNYLEDGDEGYKKWRWTTWVSISIIFPFPLLTQELPPDHSDHPFEATLLGKWWVVLVTDSCLTIHTIDWCHSLFYMSSGTTLVNGGSDFVMIMMGTERWADGVWQQRRSGDENASGGRNTVCWDLLKVPKYQKEEREREVRLSRILSDLIPTECCLMFHHWSLLVRHPYSSSFSFFHMSFRYNRQLVPRRALMTIDDKEKESRLNCQV